MVDSSHRALLLLQYGVQLLFGSSPLLLQSAYFLLDSGKLLSRWELLSSRFVVAARLRTATGNGDRSRQGNRTTSPRSDDDAFDAQIENEKIRIDQHKKNLRHWISTRVVRKTYARRRLHALRVVDFEIDRVSAAGALDQRYALPRTTHIRHLREDSTEMDKTEHGTRTFGKTSCRSHMGQAHLSSSSGGSCALDCGSSVDWECGCCDAFFFRPTAIPRVRSSTGKWSVGGT